MAKEKETKTLTKYSKDQFLKSKKYEEVIDVLAVVLENKKLYSTNQVNKLVTDFIKKEV